MRMRTARASCRSDKPSANCMMVIRARLKAGESWLSMGRKKGRKQLIVIKGAQQVAHVKIGITFGASRMGDPGSFLGNRANRVGVQRHRLSPTNVHSVRIGAEFVPLLCHFPTFLA